MENWRDLFDIIFYQSKSPLFMSAEGPAYSFIKGKMIKQECMKKLDQIHTTEQIKTKIKNGNKEFEEGNALQLSYYLEEIVKRKSFQIAYLATDHLKDILSSYNFSKTTGKKGCKGSWHVIAIIKVQDYEYQSLLASLQNRHLEPSSLATHRIKSVDYFIQEVAKFAHYCLPAVRSLLVPKMRQEQPKKPEVDTSKEKLLFAKYNFTMPDEPKYENMPFPKLDLEQDLKDVENIIQEDPIDFAQRLKQNQKSRRRLGALGRSNRMYKRQRPPGMDGKRKRVRHPMSASSSSGSDLSVEPKSNTDRHRLQEQQRVSKSCSETESTPSPSQRIRQGQYSRHNYNEYQEYEPLKPDQTARYEKPKRQYPQSQTGKYPENMQPIRNPLRESNRHYEPNNRDRDRVNTDPRDQRRERKPYVKPLCRYGADCRYNKKGECRFRHEDNEDFNSEFNDRQNTERRQENKYKEKDKYRNIPVQSRDGGSNPWGNFGRRPVQLQGDSDEDQMMMMDPSSNNGDSRSNLERKAAAMRMQRMMAARRSVTPEQDPRRKVSEKRLQEQKNLKKYKQYRDRMTQKQLLRDQYQSGRKQEAYNREIVSDPESDGWFDQPQGAQRAKTPHKSAPFILPEVGIPQNDAPFNQDVPFIQENQPRSANLMVNPARARTIARNLRRDSGFEIEGLEKEFDVRSENDLRLSDNPVLDWVRRICQSCTFEVIPVYFFDQRFYNRKLLRYGTRKTGIKRTIFDLESVINLRENLETIGSSLLISCSKPEDYLPKLLDQTKACTLVYKKEIYAEYLAVEDAVQTAVKNYNQFTSFVSVWGSTVYHPEDIKGTFSNSFEAWQNNTKNILVRPLIEKIQRGDLGVFPQLDSQIKIPPWKFIPHLRRDLQFTQEDIDQASRVDLRAQLKFKGGENAGQQRLKEFFGKTQIMKFDQQNKQFVVSQQNLDGKIQAGNNGAIDSFSLTQKPFANQSSSKLGPWIANGSISVKEVYFEALKVKTEPAKKFIETLFKRDFYTFWYAEHGKEALKEYGFKNQSQYNWQTDLDLIQRWRQARTGMPLIDALMEELNTTGYITDIGRSILAKYLILDLKQDWRYGATYFEEKLLDHDFCINLGFWNFSFYSHQNELASQNLQAGMFQRQAQVQMLKVQNNLMQDCKKYDPDGVYVKKWIPILQRIPTFLIHKPWNSHQFKLKQCRLLISGTQLGFTTPYNQGQILPLSELNSAQGQLTYVYPQPIFIRKYIDTNYEAQPLGKRSKSQQSRPDKVQKTRVNRDYDFTFDSPLKEQQKRQTTLDAFLVRKKEFKL